MTTVLYKASSGSKRSTEAVLRAYNAFRPGQQKKVDELADLLAEKVRLRTGRVLSPFGSCEAALEVVSKLGMWLPDDAIGHYRHAFQYQQLWEAWKQIGQPDEFDIVANEYNYHLRAIWDGNETYFLYPHGNLFLDWVKPIITKDNHLALVITGTGSAKRRA